MVGSHLTDYLLENTNWDIHGLCRWRSPLDNISHLLQRINSKDRLRPIDADLQIPDTTKFKNHTGWSPEIKFEQTMSDLLDYWRKKVNSGNIFLTR